VPEPPLTRPPAPSTFLAGQLISGRYRLEHRIASGGMAEVWQAADEVLGRHVAVKILHPHLARDDAFVARFRSEAIAAARLHHPAIVAIYDTSHEDGAEAIVMELVRGTTLRDQLDGRVVLDPREVVHIGAEVADALAAAHRAGLVHRDIKPANILLCADDRVLVTDFGIAKIRDDPDSTQAGTMLGTVKYLAPEQVKGEPVDGRTDVYALGVVLFECLCARPPFTGDTPAAIALARLQHAPPRPSQLRPTIPRRLDQVILKCLEVDPAARFQSAAELRAALLEPSLLASDEDLTIIEPASAFALQTAPTDARAADDATLAPHDPVGDPPMHGPWLRPVLATVLVVTALVVAFLLFDHTDLGRQIFGQSSHAGATRPSTPTASSTPHISSVASFDPDGSGTPGENDAALPLAIDGQPSTGWKTESYNDRHFGNLKPGVGLILTLTDAAKVGTLDVTSPTQGWAASVYEADASTAPTTLSAWGSPIDAHTAIAGNTSFDLHGHTTRYVLLWITDLGDGPPLVRAEIDELVVKS
jgi:eukaryotic-like serine/threonine-protein kinase